MKIINRILLMIISFIFMFIMLLLAIYSSGAFVEIQTLPYLIEDTYGNVGLSIVFFAAFIIGAWAIYPFFTSHSRGTTTSISESELGRVEITMDALKNMIRGVAKEQDGVEDVNTLLKAGEGGVHISITGKVLPSAVIPEVTSRLQRIVKSYIEETTGVEVLDVEILIEDVYRGKKKKDRAQKQTKIEPSAKSEVKKNEITETKTEKTEKENPDNTKSDKTESDKTRKTKSDTNKSDEKTDSKKTDSDSDKQKKSGGFLWGKEKKNEDPENKDSEAKN